SPMMVKYYGQRAYKGALQIAEATTVSVLGRGYLGAPGIYSDAQVNGWKRVTEAVHEKGGRIFLQLWHVGRQSHIDMTNGAAPVAPSVVPFEQVVVTGDGWVPVSPHRALKIEEIPGIVDEFRRGAERAKAAGFDGVEIHGANGYLLDQFLQDGSNKRTDAYGGPIENRARLMLEAVDAAISVWGADRVGLHLAPRGDSHSMGDSNPRATFGYVADQVGRRKIAFICARESLKEPRLGPELKKAFGGVFIGNQDFTKEDADRVLARGEADAVAWGKLFIANPDLPE